MSELIEAENIVLKVIENVMGEPYNDNQAKSNPVLPWSSIEHIYIIIALEDALTIQFSESDLFNVVNFESLVSVVSKKLQEQAQK